LNGLGFPRNDWRDDLPPSASLSPDDAIWPADLQNKLFFRRRGNKLTDKVEEPGGFVSGDFGRMRQLVVEYIATMTGQQALYEKYGITPVLHILIRAHQYLVAKFDFDGFRIDTVKYVDPEMIQIFGNAMREFALSIGKKNFFTFGEVYDNEETIKHFIGRNGNNEGFGIDAALDFPLFYKLPKVAKSNEPVESIRQVFIDRKNAEEELLSSHGEAGRFFVSFLDNHDQGERFNHPLTHQDQVLLGVAVQFCLQGIPCLYYGTEQGLNGTKNDDGTPDLIGKYETVREALWGKTPAFDQNNFFYTHIRELGNLRRSEPPLMYGRLYFREVSENKKDFGLSYGAGGVIAFSRILSEREVIVVANTNVMNPFSGFVVTDFNLSQRQKNVSVRYSNKGTTGNGSIEILPECNFYDGNTYKGSGKAAVLFVSLQPMEVQILAG
jgi:1,4-alpha-glucan branching enzyme